MCDRGSENDINAEKKRDRSFPFESDSHVKIISSCAIQIGHVDYEDELIYIEMKNYFFP